jgi:membrane-associated protease RseP (regulator of RpoE activity)
MEKEASLDFSQILFLGILALFWVNGWAPLWIVVLIGAWYLGLLALERRGILDRWNATRALGIILMLRTNRGKRVLERVSQPRRFWRAYGEFSIWLCFVVMAGVLLLLFLSARAITKEPHQEVLPARDLLLIPGVTSFVPFWWPVAALIIALIIHEYSHGIQARAHGMQVRSFGLLLAGPLPVGAFAEPEYEEMIRAPRRERMRLYAAGPSINLLACWIVLILLSATATGFAATNDGVHAVGILEDTGAEDAGLKPYETITQINDVAVIDYSSFKEAMSDFKSGDSATMTVLTPPSQGEVEERLIEVVFTDRWDYHMNECRERENCDEAALEGYLEEEEIKKGDAFLGVSGLQSSTAAVDNWGYFFDDDYNAREKVVGTIFAPLAMLGVPIALDGHTMNLEQRAMLTAGDGAIASTLGTEGMLAAFDFLFWLAWINFLLGFANLIPMVPFDGGHLVRDGTHSVIKLVARKMDPLKAENLALRLSRMSSLFILFIIAIPIIIPRII